MYFKTRQQAQSYIKNTFAKYLWPKHKVVRSSHISCEDWLEGKEPEVVWVTVFNAK